MKLIFFVIIFIWVIDDNMNTGIERDDIAFNNYAYSLLSKTVNAYCIFIRLSYNKINHHKVSYMVKK